MKKSWYILFVTLSATLLSGCTSAFYGSSSSVNDDLYALHSRTDIARRQQAEAEARKAEAEARRAEWEAKIAEAEANAIAQGNYRTTTSVEENYSSVLADDYQSAYARRLRGFESSSYRMPSSYTNARYSSTFHYVSAYDPAFYNIMVMGDQVWVEPKYVTAMFGSWGLPSYHNAWYWNWAGWPSYRWWGPSFSIGGWGWSLSWYDPWFYDWYRPWRYNYGWYGYGHRHPHYYPHYPYYNGGGGHHPGYRPGYRPGQGVVHRPTTNHRPTPTYRDRGSNINRTQSGNREWNSGVYEQGNRRPQSGTSGSVSRTPGSNSSNKSYTPSNGRSSRRSSSSGSSGSSYNRGSSSSNWSSGSSSSRSSGYSSGSSSSSRGGGYSGGGGGSSRGGSSGSSSRGR